MEREKEEKEEEKEKPNEGHITWRCLTRNQKEVAKRILDGNYHVAQPAGWGLLDRFFIFLKSIGFLTLLDVDGEGYVRRMITIAKLLMTYNVKILLGIASMNQVPQTLFSDIGLLMTLGWTAEQVKNGVCNRGEGKHPGPVHKDTLSDALDRFSPSEIEHILNEGIKLLAKKGFIKDKVFIMDATDLETTDKYEGAGCKTVKEKHVDKKGKVIEIEVTKYGFKLILLKAVENRIVVAAKVAQIQENERNYTFPLLHQAQENLDRKSFGLLLIDRGFLDGVDLWKIKHPFRTHFIIPAKTNMDITNDARGLRKKTGEGIYYAKGGEKGREIEVMGIEGLESYLQYGDEQHFQEYETNRYKKDENQGRKKFRGNALNVVMVTKWDGKEYAPGREKVFLTTLPVSSPLEIIQKYDMRSLIENTIFRELKQGWRINKFPKKTKNAVTAHVLLTLCMFNMTNAFRTDLGQDLTQRGIRRHRLETLSKTYGKMVIISPPYYAIFDIEELAILWGKPPKFLFRADPEKFKREYGLS